MEPNELAEIDRFVLGVGRASLFEYFDLDTSALPDQREQTLLSKRRWAQGQQSNPKYKQEAIWLIKNQALCRSALIDQEDAYLKHVKDTETQKKFEVLEHFVEGAISGDELSHGGLQSIQEYALRMGVEAKHLSPLIEKVLSARGATRSPDHDPNFVDHYALLDIHHTADLDTIERAYRSHYEAARRTPDSREAQKKFNRLDAAWDVLRSPSGRETFDALRELQNQKQQEVQSPPRPPAGALRGVPAAMYRAPGDLETEISPASTEGIDFARKQSVPQVGKGLPPAGNNTLMAPKETLSSTAIRFSTATEEPQKLRQARPRPVPSPQKDQPRPEKAPHKRVPLSSKRGPSPLLILALGVLFSTIAALYWLLGSS